MVIRFWYITGYVDGERSYLFHVVAGWPVRHGVFEFFKKLCENGIAQQEGGLWIISFYVEKKDEKDLRLFVLIIQSQLHKLYIYFSKLKK